MARNRDRILRRLEEAQAVLDSAAEQLDSELANTIIAKVQHEIDHARADVQAAEQEEMS